MGEAGIPLLGYIDDEKPVLKSGLEEQEQIANFLNLNPEICYYVAKIVHVLELPLTLPRRLTIPVVSEESWSKPYAVLSVTLAPL